MRTTASLNAALFAVLLLLCCETTPTGTMDAGADKTGVNDAATDLDTNSDGSYLHDISSLDHSPASDVVQADTSTYHPDATIYTDSNSSDVMSGIDTAHPADAGPVAEADLYVSAQGTGQACSASEPCSLTTAQSTVRSLTATQNRDILVLLRGGTYTLDQAFVLLAEDSGRNGYFVIYQAYPGETPLLSGGTRISSWSEYDAARNIYQATTPAGLISRQLYVNGQRARRARGSINPAGFSVVTDGYTGPVGMETWRNPSDIELIDYMQWKSFRCTVQSISGQHIIMKQPCWSLAQWHTNLGMAEPTWIENAFELLDEPGEWYHDRTQNKIYYIPRADESLNSAEVIIARLHEILRLQGSTASPVHHIQFRGLTFSHSTWLRPSSNDGYPVLQAGQLLTGDPAHQPQLQQMPGHVTLEFARDIVFERNVFKHLGASAVSIVGGSKRCTFGGNLFTDISGSAAVIGNINQPSTSDGNQICSNINIVNNVISRIGQEYYDSPGILLTYAQNCSIAHNELHDLPYTGISMGWGWSLTATVTRNNSINGNRISNVMQRLNDGGLIYTLSTQPDTSIHDNLLFAQIHEYGGIYLDQGSQYLDIFDNVIASTPHWYLLQPSFPPVAQDNHVHNNFSDSSELMCCGDLGCCSDVNTLADNTVFPAPSWPAQANTIANGSGIDAVYSDMRPSSQRFEAEAFLHGGNNVGFLDLTFWDDNEYRDGSVDIEACTQCSNDYRIVGISNNEWLAYYIFTPAAGLYDFVFWTLDSSGGSIGLVIDGNSHGSTSISDGNDQQSKVGGRIDNVQLSSGMHLVKLELSSGYDFDFFELVHN